MELTWQLVHRRDLTAHQTYAMLRLRGHVFVDEQHIPARVEIDGRDLAGDAHHLFAWAEDELIGYARLLPPGEHPEPSIGRVVLTSFARGGPHGAELLERAIEACHELWPGKPIRLSAQAGLEEYYALRGFITTGASYLDAGIPHVTMLRPPA